MDILTDILRNSLLITGIVIIMMMLTESLKIESEGSFFNGLRKSPSGQVVFAAILGLIPGCIGGFMAVSLYAGGILSFGALLAMMIASCGDEAFMILAMMPGKSPLLFGLLFILAVGFGLLADLLIKKDFRGAASAPLAEAHHHGDGCCGAASGTVSKRRLTVQRVVLFLGVAAFIAAMTAGLLDHDHEHMHHHGEEVLAFDFLSEKWMEYLFAGLGLIVLGFICFASDHFINEHLWHHVVKKHLPVIFCWTAGILLILGLGLHYIDISGWISDNTALMVLLAAAIGLIPESGPHLIFVTLYASGIVPLPVLLASCISQDGHSSLPLLAEHKKSFAVAKLLNFIIALLVGYVSMLFIH